MRCCKEDFHKIRLVCSVSAAIGHRRSWRHRLVIPRADSVSAKPRRLQIDGHWQKIIRGQQGTLRLDLLAGRSSGQDCDRRLRRGRARRVGRVPPPSPAAAPARAAGRAQLAHALGRVGRALPVSFAPRASDVFVVTYPKCGTTWMTQICHQLRTGGDEAFGEITEVVPWDVLALDCGQDLDADVARVPARLPRKARAPARTRARRASTSTSRATPRTRS